MMNYLITVIVLLACFACSTGKEAVVSKQDQYQRINTNDIYNKAMAFAVECEKSGFKNNSCDKAVSGFEQVLSVEIINSDAWFNLGRILFYKGEMSKTKNALKNAINYRVSFVEAYSLLAKLYLFEGNMDNAITVMEKANEAVPSSNVLINDLAILLVKKGNLAEAKRLSEKVIKSNTKFIPAYITLGNVYYLEKKYELARLIYLKALDAEDDSGELYTNLGIITARLDDKESSFELLKKAEEKSPQNPYTHLNLGELYLSNGDYENAINEFNKALTINPNMVEALVNCAVAYSRTKLLDEAEDYYKKAITYYPEFSETYFNYGIFLNEFRGERTKSLNMLNKFIKFKGKEISDKHPVYRYIGGIKQSKVKKK